MIERENATARDSPPPEPSVGPQQPAGPAGEEQVAAPVCQICQGRLIEIRGKLQCERCHTIWETCCEGGRW